MTPYLPSWSGLMFAQVQHMATDQSQIVCWLLLGSCQWWKNRIKRQNMTQMTPTASLSIWSSAHKPQRAYHDKTLVKTFFSKQQNLPHCTIVYSPKRMVKLSSSLKSCSEVENSLASGMLWTDMLWFLKCFKSIT